MWQFNATGAHLHCMCNHGAAHLEPSRHTQNLHTPFSFNSHAHARWKTWDGFSGEEVGGGTAIPMALASKCKSSCLSSAACHSCQLGRVMRLLWVKDGRAFFSFVMWSLTGLCDSDHLETWALLLIQLLGSSGMTPLDGALESGLRVARWWATSPYPVISRRTVAQWTLTGQR